MFWRHSRISYFVDIFSRVENIFLNGCFQILSVLNIRFKNISKLHKNSVQKEKSSCK